MKRIFGHQPIKARKLNPTYSLCSGEIALDSSGNIYIADTCNCRIQKFDPSGKFLAKWGTRGKEDGQFLEPYAVAIDKSGNIYRP